MGSVSVWEAVFMLVVLKIPVVYLAGVVWWAIRAEPTAGSGGGEVVGVPASLDPCGWDDRRLRRSARAVRHPVRPGGGPRPLVQRRLRKSAGGGER
ncbi:MAG: hypothetical protein R6W48_06790 [Gaiellaceae bacterium]